MAELVRNKDWSQTPLGPIETWPQSLRTAASLCLASNFPINIIWGPENAQIYNDGYRVVCGDAHPTALGQDYSVTWASAWPAIGEPFRRARAGETSFLENQRMFLTRNGYLEETFFTFSLSPIRDESGGVGGLFHPVTETTATMLAERRTRALRDLTANLNRAADVAELSASIVATLSRFEFDVPFILIYRRSADGQHYRLAGHCGLEPGTAACPSEMRATDESPWPITSSPRISEVTGIRDTVLGAYHGPYAEGPDRAFIVPVSSPGADHPPLVAIVGISPRLPLDDVYRGFFELLSASLSAALATVRAREDEARRLAALAEIDRAKTTFFSNVSHEFRTPLTLMLGPLEEALARSETLSPDQRGRIELAHRNGLRLLKLVNALLDFSRIEAGRARASFVPTDLALLSARLASNFQSACDAAGVALVIDAPPLPRPVRIDREMWETIILNLMSNAFKFTLKGEIRLVVRPAPDGRAVKVSVADTGSGIQPQDQPHLFERFYRVEGANGRSAEGSGIGLALVQELVKLHGGEIDVVSKPDRGSTFTVTIPFGHDLPVATVIPAETRVSTRRADAFVQEALQWLPGPDGHSLREAETPALYSRGRVLLADDNADMRAYISSLLVADGFAVETVGDGQAALVAARRQVADLILADVMMPGLGGFGLLQAWRADPRLQDVPFLLLSARAGKEARIEGLEAGADDYLTKPFLARELIVRVAATLTRVRDRREAALRAVNADLERQVIEQTQARGRTWQLSPDLMGTLNADGYLETSNPTWQSILGWSETDVVGMPILDLIHPEDRTSARAAFEMIGDGHPATRFEIRCRRSDGHYRWISWVAITEDGKVYCIGRDITEAKEQADEVMALTAERDRLWQTSTDLLLIADIDGSIRRVNPAWTIRLGYQPDELIGMQIIRILEGGDPDIIAAVRAQTSSRAVVRLENRKLGKDGTARWIAWSATRDGDLIFAIGRDVTAEKLQADALAQAEATLRQSQKMEAVGQLTGGLAHDFNNLLTGISGSLELLQTRVAQGRVRDLERYLNVAQGAARRAATLTHRLLAFSRRQTLDPKPSDVNRMVVGMADLIRRTLGPEIALETINAGGLWTCLVDPGQLENALLNLCVNAKDAMPGGGNLTIETGNHWLDAHAAAERSVAPGQYVTLSVSDTGSGMTPDVIARAFEPFFTTKPIGQGTGLGLSMIYGFVQQSSGAIRIYSEIGHGTMVRLYLPRHFGTAETGDIEVETETMPKGEYEETVLVIDDEPSVRMIAVEVLEDMGYGVFEAADGAAGLKILRSPTRIDLLVTDVGLPGGLNGRQVADAARAIRPDLKVMFITGYAENAVLNYGHLGPGVQVLTKPFGMDVFAGRVTEMIGGPRQPGP